jgi:hypothetical protein
MSTAKTVPERKGNQPLAFGLYFILMKNNVKQLTSLKLVLRTTIMTPVKPQISKFKADKILPNGL